MKKMKMKFCSSTFLLALICSVFFGQVSFGAIADTRATDQISIEQTYSMNEVSFVEQDYKKILKEYFDNRSGMVEVQSVSYWDDMFQSEIKTKDLTDYTEYSIKDIDKDGIPELILGAFDGQDEYGYARREVLICRLKNGEVVPVFSIAGIRNGIFLASKGRICAFFGTSSSQEEAYYTIGKSKGKFSLCYLAERTYDANKPIRYYLIKKNKKRKSITEKRYLSYHRKNIKKELINMG